MAIKTWTELGRNPDDRQREAYDAARETLLAVNPPTLWAPDAEAVLTEIAAGEHQDIADDGDAILSLIEERDS